METKNKKIRLTEYDQIYYCHNKDCGLRNQGFGNWGLENYGTIIRCDNCNKHCFETPDGTGILGDIRSVDL